MLKHIRDVVQDHIITFSSYQINSNNLISQQSTRDTGPASTLVQDTLQDSFTNWRSPCKGELGERIRQLGQENLEGSMQLGFSVKGVGGGKSHLHLFYKTSDVE